MKYLWAIYSNAEPGREDEYNDWYDNTHVPDVLKVPGIISAERFHLADVQSKAGPEGLAVVKTEDEKLSHKYLALYVIETDDLTSVLQGVADRAGTDEMMMSSALSPDMGMTCFQARTP